MFKLNKKHSINFNATGALVWDCKKSHKYLYNIGCTMKIDEYWTRLYCISAIDEYRLHYENWMQRQVVVDTWHYLVVE